LIEPKRHAAVYAIRGTRLATLFAFKSERLEVEGRQQQLDTLANVFDDAGWIVPQLLEATRQSQQLYFDGVAQVDVASWHAGRVALVGDACQCLTLLAGQGASMAMAGAYLLARELRQANGRFDVAFPAYQEELKPEIKRRQVEARKLAGSFVPDNSFSLQMMYLFLKVAFLPGFRSIFARQIGARSILK
jgi:2-polyprenyl-6-methoxyphenol hydroxylase-like FAD-dependent oxidoreductase